MEFKKLLGRRVYLELPEEENSSIILDEETKAFKEKERMRKYGRLVVYAVGSGVTDELSEGDEVMIDPGSVSRVMKIPLSEDKDVILISIDDIAHIW